MERLRERGTENKKGEEGNADKIDGSAAETFGEVRSMDRSKEHTLLSLQSV